MEIWAEAGRCEGDVEYALLAAQGVHDVGADALKVQWHHPDRIFSANIPRYDTTDNRPLTQNELDAAHIEYPDWRVVVQKCTNLDIEFIPAIFDPEAIPFLNEFAISHAKIASGDLTNRWLIQDVAAVLRFHQPWGPMLALSTGAAKLDEVAQAIRWVADAGFRGTLQLLACHSAYPTDCEQANISRVSTLSLLAADMIANRAIGKINKIELGYSDHTPSLVTPYLLVAMGASMLEKHMTLLGKGHGADHEFALDLPNLFNLCQARDKAQSLMGSAKVEPTEQEMPARNGARRSLAAKEDIVKGTELTADMFVMLRPATGIPPYDLDRVIGAGQYKQQMAMVDIPAGTVVTWKMIGRASATLSVE